MTEGDARFLRDAIFGIDEFGCGGGERAPAKIYQSCVRAARVQELCNALGCVAFGETAKIEIHPWAFEADCAMARVEMQFVAADQSASSGEFIGRWLVGFILAETPGI